MSASVCYHYHTGIKSGRTKSAKNRKIAVQYYDYIDATKAQEKGIRVQDNYAYSHPVTQGSRKAETTLNSATSDNSSEYLDPDKIQRKPRKRLTATKETAYASPLVKVESSSSATDNEQKTLEVVPSTENLKKTAEAGSAYAPPIPNLGRSQSEANEGKKRLIKTESLKVIPEDTLATYAPPVSNLGVTQSKTIVGKKRPIMTAKSADSPKVIPEEASAPYAPPIPNLGGSQSEPSKGQKRLALKAKESFKGTKTMTMTESAYTPPVPNLGGSSSDINVGLNLKPTKSSKPLHLTKKTEQHAYAPPFANLETYSQTGLTGKAGGAKPADDPGYVGPVLAPSKHTEGIELKDNYAYKVTKKKEQAAEYDSPDEKYVGPVVAPMKHTEGISLENNTAYKVSVKPKKKARKVQKPIDNSDLCKAYT